MRRVEDIFGSFQIAPRQTPWTYIAQGGETKLTVPFAFVSCVLTIDGAVQIPTTTSPDGSYTIDGQDILFSNDTVTKYLKPSQQLYFLFDTAWGDIGSGGSGGSGNNGVMVERKFTTTGGETVLDPKITFSSVLLFVDGEAKYPGDYFDIVNNKLVYKTPMVAGKEVYALFGIPSSSMAAYATNESVSQVQQDLNDFKASAPEPLNQFKASLAGADGYKNIGRCPTVNGLRSIEPTIDKSIISVVEHTAGTGLGGDMFFYDADDNATLDDNGWTVVTAGGKRWKRIVKSNGFVDLADFGVYPGAVLDVALTNAWNTAVNSGISEIRIPHNKTTTRYTLNGGLVFDIPVSGMVIRGDTMTWWGCELSHSNNNIGITLKRGPDTNLFSRGRIQNMRVTGNSGALAAFAEFQDTWRSGAETVWVSGYTNGSAFRLHNNVSWTEGAYFNDVMSRDNKYALSVKRTAANGGKDSFFAMDATISHRFGVPGSAIIGMPSLTNATDQCTIYSSKIEVSGWFEAAGGHNAILIGDHQQMIDTQLCLMLDGFGGSTNGADLRAINASGVNSICDVVVTSLSQQGLYTDVSSVATGSNLGGFGQVLSVANLLTTVKGRNIARARGARYKWQISTAVDKSFTITNLPCYSTFRATLTTKGINMETSHVFFINTHGFNNLAEVTQMGVYAGTNWDKFKLKPFNGGVGGSFNDSNGAKITWDHLAGTFGQSVDATLEIEML